MIGLAVTSRYAAVSLVCLLTHNIVMIAGAAISQSIPLCAVESFVVVVVIGYILHSRYTFLAERTWPAFLRYGAAMAVNLPISIMLVWIFARMIGWPMPLAAPAATAVMVAVNFFVSRWAISPAHLATRNGP